MHSSDTERDSRSDDDAGDALSMRCGQVCLCHRNREVGDASRPPCGHPSLPTTSMPPGRRANELHDIPSRIPYIECVVRRFRTSIGCGCIDDRLNTIWKMEEMETAMERENGVDS